MNNFFYTKLAMVNIRKNSKTYIPYMLTCIGTVMMYFLIRSLSLNSGLKGLYGSTTITTTLKLGANVAAIFAFLFLFYTNSFLIKGRKKEFGLYNILGMEKRHLTRIIFYETLFTAALSLAVGLAAGILLNKLVFLGLVSILRCEIPMGFELSVKALISTLMLFGVLFFFIFLNSFRQIHLAKPVELLHGGQVGEREPKTKWLLALLGLLCLGGGYYIAVTTQNPVAAVSLFFVAVLLVIVGTYLLFQAGSITLLKLLRKNKTYYYKTKHFISVSGMIYRMKQNAAGLANICILSTMVLVMISSTLSMYIGMEDMVKNRYLKDITITARDSGEENNSRIRETAEQILSERNLTPKGVLDYTFIQFLVLEQGDEFLTDQSVLEDTLSTLSNMNSLRNLFFITQEDFLLSMERRENTNQKEAEEAAAWTEPLAEDEVLLYTNRDAYLPDVMKLFDREYRIREKVSEFFVNGNMEADVTGTYYIVVKDFDVLQNLALTEKEKYGEQSSSLSYFYGFDLDEKRDSILETYAEFEEAFDGRESGLRMECREDGRDATLAIFGGLFFIGIFLGLLFIMATILIIYYKQISEGYDDKKRFEIMQKVGLGREEVKKSIHSQVLTVFFLPLVTAGVHITFAFPVIKQILALLGLMNGKLFAVCTVGCFLAFALCYILLYAMTTKVYYKIVSWKR